MNKNFFTAEEAKERSTANLSNKIEQELEFIYEKINESINDGHTRYVFYHKLFSDEAVEFLKRKGFNVSVFMGDPRDQYPSNDTTISWK